MTKTEWLARCATAYDMGFIATRTVTRDLAQAVDVYLRLRCVYKDNPMAFTQIQQTQQGKIAIESLTDYNTPIGDVLAGDRAYRACELAALLDHPCQRCATDPKAWHTRYGFCPHRSVE